MKTDSSIKWNFHATDKAGEKVLIRGMILSFFIPAFCIFGVMIGLFSNFMESFQKAFRFAPLVEAVIIFIPSLWICSTYTKTVRHIAFSPKVFFTFSRVSSIDDMSN